MSKILVNMEPQSVMDFFEEISAIPRGSKNEEKISNYLVEFAKERNLEYVQDDALNVIIRKKATKGYEHVPSIIIQGHMDMVCEKNQDTVHDFEKDGIKLQVEDGWIKAKGTTLGADNGIAVAYALALLDSSDVEHPELEVIITADEEMGMTGAMALDKNIVKSRILINIDTEEEGELYVSCAGGARGNFGIPVEFEAEEKEGLHIKIRGLHGGHSGCDAHEQRANANRLLARTLNALGMEMELRISKVCGGAKTNAIPREADGLVYVENKEKAISIIKEMEAVFQNEYVVSDSGVRVEVSEEKIDKLMTKESGDKVVETMLLHPNGVRTMSMSIKGLVESSLNLGVVETEDNKVWLKSSIRSSVLSKKLCIIEELKAMAKLVGAEFEDEAHYPAWQYRQESKIRDISAEVYEKMYGEKPGIKAIHAGLECGLFDEKFGDMDMISFGPDIREAHTPEEKINIRSIKNIWKYLLEILKESKNYY